MGKLFGLHGQADHRQVHILLQYYLLFPRWLKQGVHEIAPFHSPGLLGSHLLKEGFLLVLPIHYLLGQDGKCCQQKRERLF